MNTRDADHTLHPAQIAAYRRMTTEQKLAQLNAMSWQARALKASFLRERYPDWSEEAIHAKVKEIFLLATT